MNFMNFGSLGGSQQDDSGESSAIVALATQAANQDWTERQAEAQLAATFPEEVPLGTLLSAAGSVGDVASPREVAEWIDHIINVLAARLEDRKRGFIHVTLAGAWLMRAQFGGDAFGLKLAREHHTSARLLVPNDGSSTYQALSMTGMLLSMLDPDGDEGTDDTTEYAGAYAEEHSAEGAPELTTGYQDSAPQQSSWGLDLSQLPESATLPMRLLEELLSSDDRMEFISEHLNEMDDNFLLLCNMLAEVAGQEGQYEFAAFLQAVAGQVQTLRERQSEQGEHDEQSTPAGTNQRDRTADVLPGWDILAMLRHGKQARSGAAGPGTGALRNLSSEALRGEQQIEQQSEDRQRQLQSDMDFLLDIVRAADDTEVEALMDTRPSAWQPKLVRLIEQVEDVVREEGKWLFASRLKAARESVLMVRAARPLETALADIEVEETGRPTYEIVEENPVLKGWEALERLGQWATLSHRQGDEGSAYYYCNVICYLGRYFHADNPTADPGCAGWEGPLRRHLEQRQKDTLEQAIEATAEWVPPAAPSGLGSPLDDLPSNLAALLAAWDNDDGEQVDQLGSLVEAGLWVRRLSMEALTVTLIEMDMVAHLAEYHVMYPLEEKNQVLEYGLQACDEAAKLCEQIKLEGADGYYHAVKGNGLFSMNRLAEAEEAYQRAVEIFRRQADKQPEIYTAMWVRTLGNLANVVAGQNGLEAALDLTRDAVAGMKDIIRSVRGSEQDWPQNDLVALLLIHATVQHATGRTSAALETLDEAEALAREQERSGSRMRRDALARVLNNKAVMLTGAHRLDEGEVKMWEAVDIWRVLRTEDENEYGATAADTLFNLGNIQLVRRKPGAARDLYVEAGEIYSRLAHVQPEVYNPKIADLLTNLGGVLEDLHEEEDAREAYDRSVELLEALTQKTPDVYLHKLTTALNNKGNFLSKQHEYEDAEAVLRRAIEFRESEYRRSPVVFGPTLAGILTNLGVLLRVTGRPEEARKELRRAISLDPHNRDGTRWRAKQELAYIERAAGSPQKAYELLLGALEDLESVRGSLRHRQDLISFHQPEFLGIYRQLVDLCLEMRRVEEAWLWAERSKGRTLLDLLSAGARPRLQTPEAQARFNEWQKLERNAFQIEERLVDWFKKQGGSPDEPSRGPAVENSTLSALPALAFSSVPQIRTEADAEAAQHELAQVRMAAAELQRRLIIELDEGGDGDGGDGVGPGSSLRPAPLSAEQLALDLKSLAQPHDGAGDNPFMDGNTQQGNLGRVLLVDYFLLGANRYVVFLLPLWEVTPGKPLPLDHQVVQLGSEQIPVQINQLVDVTMAGLVAARQGLITKIAPSASPGRTVRDYMNSMWPVSVESYNGVKVTEYKGIRTSEELGALSQLGGVLFEELPVLMGEALLNPWKARLHRHAPDELVVVPHTILHLFPLHATEFDEQGTPLIERYPMSYLPSAGMAGLLVRRRNAGHKPRGRLVLGPPATDERTASAPGREYLAGAVVEAEVVAEQLGVTEEGQPFSGRRMTIERLRERAGNLQVLHLPTHSKFDFGDYLRSGILFNDRVLTIFEILSDASLDLSGLKLCYLSSCESGLADVNAGDELQGLVWALTYAGAESVVGTLWPVEDDAARLMAIRFYEECITGATLREAWRTALLAVKSDSKKLANPYFWAAFVLSGNGFERLQ